MIRRGPRWRPDELDEAQRALYDEIIGGPRSQGPQAFAIVDAEGRLEGPFDAMLLAPEVGAALQNLGAAIRYRTSLSPRVRELCILLVGTSAGSRFEWTSHSAIARGVGLTAAELTAIQAGEVHAFTDPDEAAAGRLVVCLLAGRVPDAEFDAAQTQLGARGVFEVSTLVGYYQLLSAQLALFGADLDAITS